MTFKACALGALLLSCTGVALAFEPAVPVTGEWTNSSSLIDQARQIQQVGDADWGRSAPRAGYGIPEREPAHQWPFGRDLPDVELPAGIDLDLPSYIGRPVRDSEDDVVRCMAIG